MTYFQSTFLTSPVAWSIFHGKTTALKSDFNLCSYSLYFTAPQRLQILQGPRLQDQDFSYLNPQKGMSDLWMIQEQKTMPKPLKAELGPRRLQNQQHLQLPDLWQYFQALCPAPTWWSTGCCKISFEDFQALLCAWWETEDTHLTSKWTW